jgi:undecaprenyl-diphosphatase
MLENILSADTALFRVINGSLQHPIVYWSMEFLSNSIVLSLLCCALFGWGIWKKKILARWLLPIACVMVMSDVISARYIKPWVERPRPCHHLEDVNLTLEGCGGKHSMPSNHAANMMGFAVILLLFERSLWWTIIVAFFIGYSRIFLGKHYPADVIVGFILGSFIAVAIHKIFLKFPSYAKKP